MNRTCDKCNANIPHGNPYICVTHNIEYMDKDLITMTDSINIVDSDEILILCGRCGNRMTKVAMKQILKGIPIDQNIVRNN